MSQVVFDGELVQLYSAACNVPMTLDQANRFLQLDQMQHQKLKQFANGDIDSLKITHWCVGTCCSGSSVEQKRSLLQFCKYPVPLLYRWLHAHRALQFCKDVSCSEEIVEFFP